MMSGVGTGNDGVADFQAVGGDDITFFAVLILHQRNVSGTVGVVFQGQDLSGNPSFVSLEVDNTVFSSVAATAVTNSDSTVAVAAGVVLQRLDKALLRSNLRQAESNR